VVMKIKPIRAKITIFVSCATAAERYAERRTRKKFKKFKFYWHFFVIIVNFLYVCRRNAIMPSEL